MQCHYCGKEIGSQLKNPTLFQNPYCESCKAIHNHDEKDLENILMKHFHKPIPTTMEDILQQFTEPDFEIMIEKNFNYFFPNLRLIKRQCWMPNIDGKKGGRIDFIAEDDNIVYLIELKVKADENSVNQIKTYHDDLIKFLSLFCENHKPIKCVLLQIASDKRKVTSVSIGKNDNIDKIYEIDLEKSLSEKCDENTIELITIDPEKLKKVISELPHVMSNKDIDDVLSSFKYHLNEKRKELIEKRERPIQKSVEKLDGVRVG